MVFQAPEYGIFGLLYTISYNSAGAFLRDIYNFSNRVASFSCYIFKIEQALGRQTLSGLPIYRTSAAEFFLWSYLKDRFNDNRPRTLFEPKKNIREEMRAIPNCLTLRTKCAQVGYNPTIFIFLRVLCKHEMDNFRKKLEKCME